MNQQELRVVADYLYDGAPRVAHLIAQVRMFRDGDRVLLWLCRNELRGAKMIDFFKEENKSESKRGVMLGVQRAMSFINHGKGYMREKLTTGDLKK